MTNSRPRSTPARGRASSRYFVWIWYSDKRVVLVGRVLALDQQGEQLLVRRREQVVDVLAVLEPEQRVAVVGPAAARLEDLARDQRREVDLLRPDAVHLLAHDLRDVVLDDHAERQPRVDARRDAADVAGADEQLVARHLRVGRVVAQGPQEKGGESKHDQAPLRSGDRRSMYSLARSLRSLTPEGYLRGGMRLTTSSTLDAPRRIDRRADRGGARMSSAVARVCLSPVPAHPLSR